MYQITLSKEIKQNCPEFRGAAVFAEVTNTPYCEGLWQEIATFTQALRARETADRKSPRLNSSHITISYDVFCLK